MKNLPTLNEVSTFYHRIDLLEKVVQQIQKDFTAFNFTIIFKDDVDISPYQQLFDQILPLVDEMLNDNYTKLLSLLYRIDIDEDFLNRRLKEVEHADTDEVIADLIIKRELQKVIIREMYSSK